MPKVYIIEPVIESLIQLFLQTIILYLVIRQLVPREQNFNNHTDEAVDLTALAFEDTVCRWKTLRKISTSIFWLSGQ